MNKDSYGFTIIEIIVTIIVVAILAGIVMAGYSPIERSGRDSARESRATIIAEAMESFYLKNGEYPSCSQLTVSPETVAATILLGIDVDVLRTPLAESEVENSIVCSTPSGDEDVYVYDVGSDLLSWTLSFKNESDGTLASIISRQVVASVPAGDPDPDPEPEPEPEPEPNPNVSADIPFTLAQIENICANPGVAVSGYNSMTMSTIGTFTGTSGNDVMWRTGGIGDVNGENGNDIICVMVDQTGQRQGGDGNDVIVVSGGTNTARGNAGNDVLISIGSHTGILDGDEGNDTLYASEGVSQVNGDDGFDRATVISGSGGTIQFINIEEMF